MPTIEDVAADVAALHRRLDAAESVLAIHELKARYGELVDERFELGSVVETARLWRLAHEAAALFTEDGTWDGGPGLGAVIGRSAIAERLASPTLTFARHLFVKPRISVDGNRASGRWDLLVPCATAEGTPRWMCGYEDDEYLRVDGTWLHRSMHLTTICFAPAETDWRILT
ncbi:MAG: nuclear transport factor 2 family protein [Acidimicrobiales bacterium]